MGMDCLTMNRTSVLQDLEEHGYSVIPNVCSAQDCNDYIGEYKEWLSQFTYEDRPDHMHSVIQSYAIGHFDCTWKARLATKPIFASIWETEKLLSSFDGVAVSSPPETDNNGVYNTGSDWLHVDQEEERRGLHAYQGALNLEESSETDFCFRVLKGSHKHLEDFYKTFNEAAKVSNLNGIRILEKHEKDWFYEKGCALTKVPVPKGGMVLWDSRTIHDNCRPEKGRKNPDRWRFVVFSCMTPAQWAKPADMATKRHAYNKMLMTSHWPSQDINVFDGFIPPHDKQIKIPRDHSDTTKSREVRLLAGDMAYDFDDGESNGPNWNPLWTDASEYANL